MPRRRNGEHEARELELYVDNDSQLYHSQGLPILKNLATKKARGVYNHALAVKLYMYLMTNGAKKYAREFDSPGNWNKIFSTADRKEVAERFARDFETEYATGAYDSLLPKKYQKKSNPGSAIPRNKWVSGQVKVGKNGKIEFKFKPRSR